MKGWRARILGHVIQPVPVKGFGQKSYESLFSLGIMSISYRPAQRNHERDAHLMGSALAE